MPELSAAPSINDTRTQSLLVLIARLKPAVNMQQATAELNVLYDRIEKADPEHRPAAAWSNPPLTPAILGKSMEYDVGVPTFVTRFVSNSSYYWYRVPARG